MLISTVGYAQSSIDTTIALPEVRIEAPRSTKTSPAAHVTRLDAQTLRRLPVNTVADAIDHGTAAFVLQYGPTGRASISLRGSSARHTRIVLDGLLLSDPQSNEIDLSLIPISMIESISVSHGPASQADIPGGLGGTVVLETAPSDQTRLRSGVRTGAYGQRSFDATGSVASGRFSILVSGERSAEDGDFPYTNIAAPAGEQLVRNGADKTLLAAFARSRFETDHHQISLSVWGSSVERGLPGPANAPPADARQWDDQLRLWLKSKHRFGDWTAKFGLVGQDLEVRYENPADGTNQTTASNSFEVSASATKLISASVLAVAGSSFGIDRSGNNQDDRTSAFVEATYQSSNTVFVPSIRVDRWQTAVTSYTAFVPRFGLNLQAWPGSPIQLKASGGRTFRTPSMVERYWIPGGNAELEPESGWSLDAGAAGTVFTNTNKVSVLTADITGYYAQLTDQIVWFPSFAGTGVQVWRPVNIGRVATSGVELSITADTEAGDTLVKAAAAVAFTRAIDRSDPESASYGNQLRYVPLATGTAFVQIERRSISGSITGRFVGSRYITSDESMAMEPHLVVDAQVKVRFGIKPTGMTLGLQLENAFNAAYSVIRFYPMPPRNVSLRFEISIQ